MRWWTTLSNRVKDVEETVIEEENPDAETSINSTDSVKDFLNDFTSTKQNMLGCVSSWLLSERREERIDDLVQEMDINGFWLLDRRESIAQTLLKRVAFKNEFHREMKFKTTNELVEHKSQCICRSLNCRNEGCGARFCAIHKEKHDRTCPFKIVPCKQKCLKMIVRHEMDQYCITICPIKLANCPSLLHHPSINFFTVRRSSTVQNLSIHVSYTFFTYYITMKHQMTI